MFTPERPNLRQFPPIPPPESRFWLLLRGYIHEIILIPLSVLYCKLTGTQPECGILPLPFNLLLKSVYVTETTVQEVISMKCARAIGLPVPCVLSYGKHPHTRLFSHNYSSGFGSILMTRIPGRNLNEIHESLSPEELATIMSELESLVGKMRQYKNPWGNRVCSTNGDLPRGIRVPAVPMDPVNNAEDFVDLYIKCANRSLWSGRVSYEQALTSVYQLKETRHPVVFTHGDLLPQNVMVENGHISGIVDWEYAGWFPDYWEYCEMLRFPSLTWWWPKLVLNMPGFKYKGELGSTRYACQLASESFNYQ